MNNLESFGAAGFKLLNYEITQLLNPMFRNDLLQTKRVLITGGGTGLGKGMAERFLELGATVYICGRREEVLTATAAELHAKGPIHALSCDVRKLDAVEQMMETIWSAGALDILVDNAAGNFIARTRNSRALSNL